MTSQRSIDVRLLGVLSARGGGARPGELREATGLPARTLTRALGRLEEAGMLAERSKGIVRLSAPAWLVLDAGEPYHDRPGGKLEDELLDVDEDEDLDVGEDELDDLLEEEFEDLGSDQDNEEGEDDELLDATARRGFWEGFLEA